jgi:hypothetical protein
MPAPRTVGRLRLLVLTAAALAAVRVNVIVAAEAKQSAPTLTVVGGSESTINLSWTRNGGSAYDVYASKDGSEFMRYAHFEDSTGGSASYAATIYSLTPGSWSFKVKSIAGGGGTYSGTVTTPVPFQGTTPPPTTAPAPTTTTAPTTSKQGPVCEIAPADDYAAIQKAIASCPDGQPGAPVTIRFPAGATYRQADRIILLHRHDVILDGRGSTLRATYPSGRSQRSQLTLFKPRNVIVRGFNLEGSFYEV